MIRNASGQLHYPRFTNHFSPKAVMFEERHFWQIVASDIGLMLTAAALYFAAQKTSWWTVFCYYGVPYLL
jgi:omega-6 fatty acid desaturase (delta-12 desaturase)